MFNNVEITVLPYKCGAIIESMAPDCKSEGFNLTEVVNPNLIDSRVKLAMGQGFRDQNGQIIFLTPTNESDIIDN